MPTAVGVLLLQGAYAAAGLGAAAGATAAGVAVLGTTVGSLVGSAAMMVAGAAYGTYNKRGLTRKAIAEYNASLSDRTQTYRSAEAARTIIYGETRVNALLTFACTHGDKRENVTMVLTFSGYPIDNYKTFWADDIDVGRPGAPDWFAPNGFATTDTRLPEAVDADCTGAGWTYNLAPHLPAGYTDLVVDAVTYIEKATEAPIYNEAGDISNSNYADQSILLRPPGNSAGSQWSLSGTYVTVSTDQAAGKKVVITYRYKALNERKLKIKYYTGHESAANLIDTDLIEVSNNADPSIAQWKSDHKGFGIARAHVTLSWDETVYANGLPNISAIVFGRRVYDPRTGQSATDETTWSWSDNPALCVADYIRLSCGATYTEIDWVSVAEAANICDEWLQAQPDITITNITRAAVAVITTAVPHKLRTGSRFYITSCPSMPGMVLSSGTAYYVTRISDTQFSVDRNSVGMPVFSGSATGRHMQRRFTCNGVISTEADVKSNLEQLLSSMVGLCIYSGGKFILRAAAYRAPVLTLDESDLAEGTITLQARAPRADLFNAVRGTFRDPAQNYAVTDFEPYIGDASTPNNYVSEDSNEVIFEDIALPFTDDMVMAQRIAKLILRRHRQAVAFEATFKIYAYAVQPGDTVRLAFARYGWNGQFEGSTGKVFRVIDREFINLSTVKLSLIEEASAIYNWNFDTDAVVIDPSPNTLLPRPSDVETPNVYLPTTGYYARADGVRVSFLKFSWDAPIALDAHMEIFWKRAGALVYNRIVVPTGQVEWIVENVGPNESYLAYFVFVNSVGARGEAVFMQPFNTGSMPSEQPPLSANLLKNAVFETGTHTWEAVTFNAPGSTTVFRKLTEAPTAVIGGSPSSAALAIATNFSGNGRAAAAYSDYMSVTPQRTYVGYANLIPYGSSATVGIRWYDENNNVVGLASYGNVIPERRVIGQNFWNNPANYRVSSVFATAPVTARKARLFIDLANDWAAEIPTKMVSVYRPFFGPIAANIRELPAWDPGGHNVFTVTRTGTVAGPLPISYKGATGAEPWHTILTAENLPAGTLTATLTGMLVLIAGTGGNVMGATTMEITINSGTPIYLHTGRSPMAFGVGSGAEIDGAVLITHTIMGFAGGTVVIRALGGHYYPTDNTTGTLRDMRATVQVST